MLWELWSSWQLWVQSLGFQPSFYLFYSTSCADTTWKHPPVWNASRQLVNPNLLFSFCLELCTISPFIFSFGLFYVVRSPVFGHMSTSFSGLTTIRAYSRENDFENQFQELQDRHSSAYFMAIGAGRGIGVALDCVANLYLLTVVLSFFFLPASKYN